MGKWNSPAAAALLGLAGFAAVVLIGSAGWKGAPNGCLAANGCFCEAARPEAVKQPANTWSALAFVAAGVWLAGRTAGPYPFLVVLIGVGTAFFHASLTWWGGTLDYLSMYLFISWVIARGVVRAARLNGAAMLPLFLAAFLPAAAVNLLDLADTPPIFAVLVTGAILSEAAAAFLRKDLRRRGGWMTATLGCFAMGFAVWSVSNDGGLLCRPESLLQGHAAWHVLTAAATVTLFLYYESERPALTSS